MSHSHSYFADGGRFRVLGRVSAAAVGCMLWLLAGPADARAQVPRFFNPGVVAFEPEIGVVNSGVVNDVQATVSADQRYVTLTMRPSNTQLLALREFTFETNGGAAGGGVINGIRLGFVGGVHFAEEARGRFAPVRAHNRNDKPGEVIHPMTGTSAGGTVGAVVLNPPARLVTGAGEAILTQRGMTQIIGP